MKRILWMFGMILVALTGIIFGTYLFRKYKALNQYVHASSHAIISVALDDLLLDNLDQIFKSRTSDIVPEKSNLLDVKNWWKAGLEIPAQIHFFSLADDPLTFFTIQRIGDIGKWHFFLTEHAVDSLQVLTDGKGLTQAELSSYSSMLYNEQYVLFRIGLSKHDTAEEMSALLSEQKDWVPVREVRRHLDKRSDAHVAYYHTDGTFQLFADISKNQIGLSGKWQFTTHLPTETAVREANENMPFFLSFWSALPLAETPVITKSLSVFSGMEEGSLIANSDAYIDLFISNKMTTQQDTIVIYDYDEDFNSIEKKEIQEKHVPVVESIWKGNEQLASLLPHTLFYKFNKTHTDSLILLSTDESVEFHPIFKVKSSPFHLQADFSHVPSSWDGALFKSLQQHYVKVNIVTAVSDHHVLKIDGSIRYKE